MCCPLHAENQLHTSRLYIFSYTSVSVPFGFDIMCACVDLARSSRFSNKYSYPLNRYWSTLPLVNICRLLCLFAPYFWNNLRVCHCFCFSNLPVSDLICCRSLHASPSKCSSERGGLVLDFIAFLELRISTVLLNTDSNKACFLKQVAILYHTGDTPLPKMYAGRRKHIGRLHADCGLKTPGTHNYHICRISITHLISRVRTDILLVI